MVLELFVLLLALVGAGGALYVLARAGSAIARTQIEMDRGWYDGRVRRFGWPRHWLHPDDQKAERNRALKITRGWKDRAARKERWPAFGRWLVPWKRRG